jgi:hypothetical protein
MGRPAMEIRHFLAACKVALRRRFAALIKFVTIDRAGKKQSLCCTLIRSSFVKTKRPIDDVT